MQSQEDNQRNLPVDGVRDSSIDNETEDASVESNDDEESDPSQLSVNDDEPPPPFISGLPKRHNKQETNTKLLTLRKIVSKTVGKQSLKLEAQNVIDGLVNDVDEWQHEYDSLYESTRNLEMVIEASNEKEKKVQVQTKVLFSMAWKYKKANLDMTRSRKSLTKYVKSLEKQSSTLKKACLSKDNVINRLRKSSKSVAKNVQRLEQQLRTRDEDDAIKDDVIHRLKCELHHAKTISRTSERSTPQAHSESSVVDDAESGNSTSPAMQMMGGRVPPPAPTMRYPPFHLQPPGQTPHPMQMPSPRMGGYPPYFHPPQGHHPYWGCHNPRQPLPSYYPPNQLVPPPGFYPPEYHPSVMMNQMNQQNLGAMAAPPRK